MAATTTSNVLKMTLLPPGGRGTCGVGAATPATEALERLMARRYHRPALASLRLLDRDEAGKPSLKRARSSAPIASLTDSDENLEGTVMAMTPSASASSCRGATCDDPSDEALDLSALVAAAAPVEDSIAFPVIEWNIDGDDEDEDGKENDGVLTDGNISGRTNGSSRVRSLADLQNGALYDIDDDDDDDDDSCQAPPRKRRSGGYLSNFAPMAEREEGMQRQLARRPKSLNASLDTLVTSSLSGVGGGNLAVSQLKRAEKLTASGPSRDAFAANFIPQTPSSLTVDDGLRRCKSSRVLLRAMELSKMSATASSLFLGDVAMCR